MEAQDNNQIQDQSGNISKPLLANRVYKFRAWDDGKKQWLLGYEYPNLGGFSLDGECILMGEWASVCTSFMFENDGKKRTDLKVTQFTGLKDINNKEIYEGDIIKGKTFSGNENISFVKYDNQYGCWQLQTVGNKPLSFPIKSFNKELEIIGNIFENVNLLPNLI